MAFGLPASYTDIVELTGSRALAREAVERVLGLLGWNFVHHGADRFIATVPFSGSSWGETVMIVLEPPGVARVTSQCRIFQVFDWGKNKKNVDTFIERFALRELRYAKTSPQPESFDSDGKTPLERALGEEDLDESYDEYQGGTPEKLSRSR